MASSKRRGNGTRSFDSFMMSHGYKRLVADQCVYVRRFQDDKFVILLYVDDMLIVGEDRSMINKLKNELSKSFDMKYLGPAQQILGMKIVQESQKGVVITTKIC